MSNIFSASFRKKLCQKQTCTRRELLPILFPPFPLGEGRQGLKTKHRRVEGILEKGKVG